MQILAVCILEVGLGFPHIRGSFARIVPLPARFGDVWLDSIKVRRYNVASYFLITKTVVVFINRKTPGFAQGQ
ncbi:hypothetical protein AAW02_10305 [Aeromonas dhakensis]|nr:hypothetical protein CK627_13915 [Aeromonas dhakensis]PHS84147.1 hypothetical protein AAW03_17030 [Aeromonas dhakensis]PHS88283.1 hypothetical protein AAW02_10305 [Aeromonas dhakensis]RFS27342.1 hypothetical protein DYE42_05855 [Aeromonas dhakensis]RUQ14998.1 hypothetical protein CX648_13815 [Aeromonas dhakensis]